MRKAIFAAGLVLLTVGPPARAGGGGCMRDVVRATQAKGIAVALRQACFTPTILWVTPGRTVTWKNYDEFQHTVTATGFVFSSPDLSTNDSFTYRFTRPGIYAYSCIYHPGMVGAVVVGTPVAPKAVSNILPPGNGEGNVTHPVSAEAASSEPVRTAIVKRADPATTISVAAIAAALLGSIGFVFGRRRREST